MNILYHHRTQAKGGEGAHIREMIGAFRELGHSVFIVSPPGVDISEEWIPAFAGMTVGAGMTVKSGMTGKVGKAAGFWKWVSRHTPQIVFEALEFFYNFVSYKKIKRILDTAHIDFIYERYAFFGFSAAVLAKKYGIPLVLEVNEVSGIERQRGQILVGLANRIEKSVFRNAAAISIITAFLKDEIIRRGIEQEKLFVIPNAVNVKKFDANINGGGIREKLGLKQKVVLTFIGHFSRWDKLDFLIDAFRDISRERENSHLMIIGDGPERRTLAEYVKNNRIGDNVSLAGKIASQEIPEYIAASDICVIPNLTFGSPIVMFEFMAMAKPVVVPSVGPARDVITDSVNGVLFEKENKAALKRCALDLIDSPAKRTAIGQEARNTVLNKHLWKHNAEKIIEIYKSAVNV